jgi:predicted Rossmann fold nucleotide-binding protein DprA/Smf involved in DNA uptake
LALAAGWRGSKSWSDIANTLTKQGAKLVATWENGVWEELLTDIKGVLHMTSSESPGAGAASLFPDAEGSPHQNKIRLPKADESTHIDQLVEMVEAEMSSSEVSAATVRTGTDGRVRQLPAKNFVKTFSLLAASCRLHQVDH